LRRVLTSLVKVFSEVWLLMRGLPWGSRKEIPASLIFPNSSASGVMTQFIRIGSNDYFNLRLAIMAATTGVLTGQTIDIGEVCTTFAAPPPPSLRSRTRPSFAIPTPSPVSGPRLSPSQAAVVATITRAIPSSPATPGSTPLKATEVPAFLSGSQSITFDYPTARRSMPTRPQMEAATPSSRESRGLHEWRPEWHHQQNRYRLPRSCDLCRCAQRRCWNRGRSAVR
jgi:hypothetical protein